MAQIEALPGKAMQLQRATCQDSILSQVITFTKTGWPNPEPEGLKPFRAHRNELPTFNGCQMWGIRVALYRHFFFFGSAAKLQKCVL